MNIDLTFLHHFSINFDACLPSSRGGTKVYYYPGADERGGHDGILVEITPENGTPWLGMFASDSWRGITGVWSCPDRQSLCVVYAGQGYIVRADNPKIWREIPPPVREVKVLAEHQLLIVRDLTSLTAYGTEGFAWTTKRIALDELTIEAVEGDILRGRALIPGGPNDKDYVKWADYEIDLRSGEKQEQR